MSSSNYIGLHVAFSEFASEGKRKGRGQHAAHEAAERLLHCLKAGDLRAFHRSVEGLNPIDPARWRSIETETFKRALDPAFRYRDILGIKLSEVVIEEAHLLMSQTTIVNDESNRTPRGGRPAIDRVKIAVTIAMVVYDPGFSRTQEGMINCIQQRFAELYGEDKEPSRTTLQPIVSRLWAERAKHDKKSQT